jgi:hypothetical protein
MNRKTFHLSLLSFAAVIMLASLLTTPAAADGNPSASGHGNRISLGELRTFSFTAVQQKDGTVIGEAEVFNRGFPVRVHQKIDCLKFVEGNKAIMSGPITQSSDPGVAALGNIAVFGVEDNGEGVNAPTDRITTVPDYAPEEGIDCNDFTFVDDTLRNVNDLSVVVRPLGTILAGNIQVKP